MLELRITPRPRGTETPPQQRVPQLVVHQGGEPARWDQWVEGLGGGPFHCAAWARYRTEANKRPLFFAWYEPGSPDPVAVAIGIQTAVPGPLTARSIHFDGPPATRLDARRLVPDIAHWMRSHPGVADACLGSFDTDQAWTDATAQPTRIEFHIEPAPEDQLLARMRKLARRSVRRAQRHGVEIDADAAQFREFVDLYASTLDRLHRVKGVPAVLTDRDEFAQRLAALRAAGAARLFLATTADVPVAGALFTMFGGRAFYLSGGTNEVGRQTGAMAAIIYRGMCEFSTQGFARINLGGVPAGADLSSDRDHGLYAFKLGMGAVPHPCSDTRIVVRPIRRRFIQAARSTRSAVLRTTDGRHVATRAYAALLRNRLRQDRDFNP